MTAVNPNCQSSGGRQRCTVTRLMEQHGDAMLSDLLVL
jgi:hypothetical protein